MTCKRANKGHSKFTVFTIKNYGLYQASDKQNDKQMTSKRQTNDTQNINIITGVFAYFLAKVF